MTLVITLIIFVLIFGLIVFVHELGHFTVAKLSGIKVEEFGFGFPPKLFSRKKGETEYSINAIPFGGFVKMLGEDSESKDERSFSQKSALIKSSVAVAGVLMNLVLAWVLLSVVLWLPTSAKGDKTIFVAGVLENSAADKAGMIVGDTIKQIDQTEITDNEILHQFTTTHTGQTVALTYLHNGVQRTSNVELGKGEAPLGVSVASFSLSEVKVQHWWQAPVESVKIIWSTIKVNFQFIGGLIANIFGISTSINASTDQISGPVGIYGMVAQFTALGWVYVLLITAQLSLAVAIFNILPVPALDGGRVLFIFLNRIFGKKVISAQIENVVHIAGFILLMLLFVFVTYRDILKLVQ